MRRTFILATVMMLFITTSGFPVTYASHGSGSSGGGGSCGSTCTPPTLGVDKDGKIRVEGGLTINSAVFDVELYSQTIPTQILNKDETTTVILKIFENEGVETVSHAELHFAPYEKPIEGVLVENSS